MPSADRSATAFRITRANQERHRDTAKNVRASPAGGRAMRACTLAWVALLAFAASNANAAMRCGTGLIDVGDKIGKVQEKCGMPVAQQSEGPTTRYGSVRITVWVYGPDGGGYRYLRFVDANLVQIELRREAPTGRLLPWK